MSNSLFFLSANFVPQHEMLISELIGRYDLEVHSVHISENYTFVPVIKGLFTYKKNKLTKLEIFDLIIKTNPRLLYVAGYSNRDYFWIAKKVKKKLNIPIIVGSDTQYKGTLKQHILKIFLKGLLKKSFSHIWVAGPYQFEWARLLGFSKEKIIQHLYSGNDKLFSSVSSKRVTNNYPKVFLFIGRLVHEKGIINLKHAWQKIEDKKGWKIIFAGEGPLRNELDKIEGFELRGFINQDELIGLFEHVGAFVLPSTFEPWGVVIHEAAMAGIPLCCSYQCGATPQFLINRFNGYTFDANSIKELQFALESIINSDSDSLKKMGTHSRELGMQITQEISAASLMSVLKD